MATCTTCGHRLAALVRSDARYCSSRCRVRAHRSRQVIPEELRRRPRWVRHSRTKRPVTITGSPASVTDPSTWTTYARARASHSGAGMGFVLNGDGICCIDLDHCIADDQPTEPAARFLERLPATYIELSPSGTGLHVWGRAHVPAGRRTTIDGLSIEVYGTGRYLTITGRRFGSSPSRLVDLSEVVATIT